MRRAFLTLGLVVLGCSPSVQPEDAGVRDAGAVDAGTVEDAGTVDAGTPDAGTVDSGVPDAGAADAGVAWAQVQPLLWQRCGSCHAVDGGLGGATYFMTHPEVIQPSTKCPGETIAVCISRALQIQDVEGSGCRTYNTPFHRESWICLTPPEIDFVVGWVDAGAPEF